MKTLNLYIFRQLIGIFILTLVVLSSVFLLGMLFKSGSLLLKGGAFSLIFEFMLCMLPKALTFTLPFALLVSVVLLFSRMSADNEVTAMRASGVSLWQIVAPCIGLAAILCGVCLYLQLVALPRASERFIDLKYKCNAISPDTLLEPGRFIEAFDGMMVYIGDRKDGRLYDIDIYMKDKQTGEIYMDISAAEGIITHNKEAKQFDLTVSKSNLRHGDDKAWEQDEVQFPMVYGDSVKERRVVRKVKSLPFTNVLGRIRNYQEQGVNTMPLYVELHKRLALALSPLAFLMMGIPFGIRTNRSETSIGMVVSVGLVLAFYVFIILAENLERNPELHPDFIIWLPNIIYQLGGLWALRKISRH